MSSKVKKFDFSKLDSAKAKDEIKSFKTGLQSLNFQNKVLQYQIALEKKENALTKKVASLEKRFDKVKERENIVKSMGKVPAAIYDDILNGYNSVSNGEAILFQINSRVDKMQKELDKCQSDEQKDIVQKYHTIGFIEPLKIAKQVEAFLLSRGFDINTSGLEEAEVLSSKLLPKEVEVKEVVSETTN